MNKIEKLINKYCPDGVEFKELGEVCEIKSGQSVSKVLIQKNPGDYPVINSGKEPLGFINKFNTENNPIGITSRGAGVGSIIYCEGKYFRGNLNYSVSIIDKNLINVRFLFHILINNKIGIQQLCSFNGIPALNASKLKIFKIPIPPLEIQKEIVKILDDFTQLEAELEAELEARKKQYEYYRDEMLSFGDDEVEWKTIKEIFDFKNGLNKGKEFFGKGTPIINFTDVFNNISLCSDDIKGRVEVTEKEKLLYSVKENDLFFTRTSETREEIGKVSTILEKVENYVFSGFVLRARPKINGLNSKFYAYYFSSYKARKEIIRYSTFTTRALTSGTRLAKIKIPIPSLEKQKEIVEILDKFDKLVNDISEGLPAEIKARRQQYEYYRNKLLDFKELKK